ncbi:MAG: aldo/keto reductase [Oscillospiraceae bacterium]|nr:aldo/keto reductase [Oscillospiraceae bacterium]
MIYRTLGNTGLKVSVIGLGAEHVTFEGYDEMCRVIDKCIDAGINYFDFFMAAPDVRTQFGKALGNRRKDIILAVHMGSIWEDEQYKWSRDYDLCVEYIEDFYERLGTNYIDMFILHLVDDLGDFATVMSENHFYGYAMKLKQEGRVKHIGISTHSVSVALAAVNSKKLELIEFPVNPIFDTFDGDLDIEYLFSGEAYKNLKDAKSESQRIKLYRYCEQMGVPIAAIKIFAGGQLLVQNNFSGLTLTPVQAVAYALSRPGVSTVLPGLKDAHELDEVLRYLDAADEEKDFSAVYSSDYWDFTGQCTYCNHCLPCPSHINIGAVTRLLDSAKAYMSDALVSAYAKLEIKPDACVKCGACESRCPFKVSTVANMASCAELFKI